MWRKRKTKINYDKLPVKHIDREAELEKIIKELEDKPKYYPTLWLGFDGLGFYPEGPKWIHKDEPVPDKNETIPKCFDRRRLKFKVGDLVKLKETAFWYEASDGSGKCDSALCYGATNKYLPISIVNNKVWATHPYHIWKYGWVKESDIAEVIPHGPDWIESKTREHGWDLYYHGVKVPQNVVYEYGPGELPTQQIGDTIYIYPAPHPEVFIDGRVY